VPEVLVLKSRSRKCDFAECCSRSNLPERPLDRRSATRQISQKIDPVYDLLIGLTIFSVIKT
jgi:hypothetical protein